MPSMERLECLPSLRLSSRKNIPASRFQHAAWGLRSSSPFPIPLSKAPCPAQDSNTAKHEASCLSAGPLRPCFSKMVNEKYPRLKNTLHGHSFYSSLLSREPFFFTASRNIFLIPSQNQESTYRKTGLSVSIYIPCCHPNGSQLTCLPLAPPCNKSRPYGRLLFKAQ